MVDPPLYDPRFEHDACGVGFVADARGRRRHEVLGLALAGLASLGHRGAFGADGESSDGAGVALPLSSSMLWLVADATATVLHHPYRKVIVHPSPQTAQLVGVTVAAVAANAYCWLQYSGPCAVLTQGTLVIGDSCVPSATVDGAVMPSAAFETDGPMVGHVMAVNADTEYSPIWLGLP